MAIYCTQGVEKLQNPPPLPEGQALSANTVFVHRYGAGSFQLWVHHEEQGHPEASFWKEVGLGYETRINGEVRYLVITKDELPYWSTTSSYQRPNKKAKGF